MAILPTQPRRGVSPGGMPGPPMQGQGRGPNVGMPRAQSPIPSSVPGVNDVAGTPDPDQIVELFTAYTSGELSREQLISQLGALSEGQGGILGLLEDMENPQEGQQDNAMLATSPNPMGGNGLPSISPPGTIPPLEEPLDERHKRIAALIMQYGVTPEDANQMSTMLNPRMLQGGSALFQEGPVGGGGRIIQQDHPFLVESSRKDPAWSEIPRDQESNYINAGGFAIQGAGSIYSETRGAQDPDRDVGAWAAETAARINQGPGWIDPIYRKGGRAEGQHPSQQGVEGREPGDLRDRNSNLGSEIVPTSQGMQSMQPPKETGELIWAEELQQMVDSGTYLPPVPRTPVVPLNQADEGLGEVTPRTETTSGSVAAGRAAWQGERDQLGEGGASMVSPSAIETAQTPRNLARPDQIDEGLGEVTPRTGSNVAAERAAWEKYKRQQELNQYNQQELGPDASLPTGGDQTQEGSIPPQPDIIPDQGGGITAGAGGLGVMGEGDISDWLKNWLSEQSKNIQSADMPGWLQGLDLTQILKDVFTTTPGTLPGQPPITGFDPKDGKKEGHIDPGFSQEESDKQRMAIGEQRLGLGQGPGVTGVAEKALFGPGAGKITGRPEGDITDLFGTAPAGYTGETLIQPGAEGGDPYPSSTEPGMTGFKTVGDFDFPEIQSFLNSLSDEARTGIAADNLPGQIIDSLTAMAAQRAAGNIQLAQSNTNAAIAFLDRAATTTRDSAQRALTESQLEIENQRQALQQGIAVGEMTGLYDKKATLAQQELDRVNRIDEYKRVMERFALTGEVPQVDKDGNFVTDVFKRPKIAGETFEKEMSYAELAQQREISMTQTFGRLLNFDRTGKMVDTGADPLASMETLEREAFGFTKLLETSEQAGRLMEYDPQSGQMVPMTDDAFITEDNPEGLVDTMAARRYAWDKDVNLQREKWQLKQAENDTLGIELQAATVQYGQQLSALVEAGKLAEAIAVRKEKGKNDKAVLDHKKNEFKVNTLMTLSAKPSTMLFAQRNGLLDDLGLALGVDFSAEQIPMPQPMLTPNQLPTQKQFQESSPTDQQIMLAEIAAFDMLGMGWLPNEAYNRLIEWQPGSQPLRRTAITGATR